MPLLLHACQTYTNGAHWTWGSIGATIEQTLPWINQFNSSISGRSVLHYSCIDTKHKVVFACCTVYESQLFVFLLIRYVCNSDI